MRTHRLKSLTVRAFVLSLFAVALFFVGCMEEPTALQPVDQQPPEVLQAALSKAAAGGRVFVLFRDLPDPALVRAAGGEVIYTYRIVPAVAAKATPDVLRSLAANPRVVRIEPDGEVEAYDHDAELSNTWGVSRIGAGTVHHAGNTGAGVRVGVIDSGIDHAHPDLAANFKGGYDFVNSDDDPMDDNGHGTHVAGTIAARKDGVGVVGVAPEAHLYGLKVLNQSGSGSWSNIIAAIDWCVANGIQVTNNSYGSNTNPGATVQAAFDNSAALGILHVAAAGNSGNPPGNGNNVGYPARYESVIAVAATNQNDTRASFSSTGPAVELAAPGVSINSTALGGGYTYLSGTSMASPHVAGTAALVIASGLTAANDVRTRLQSTADDLGPAGRDNHYGFGLVNAAKAAASAEPAPEPEPDPTPQAIVSVSSISYSTSGGRNKDSHLAVTLTLVDNEGSAVAGASVSVTITNTTTGSSRNGTGTTGTNGTVAFTWNNAPSGCYTTTVNAVSAGGLEWDGNTPSNQFCK